MSVLIPKGFVQVEEPTHEQYENVTITIYRNKDRNMFLLKLDDGIENTEKLVGPLSIREIKTILPRLTDSLWKLNIKL